MENVKTRKTELIINKTDKLNSKTLDKAKKGTYIKIHSIPSGLMKIQLIRLGLMEGIQVFCLERLPGGTIILQRNRQEIVIGHNLAKKIKIKSVV